MANKKFENLSPTPMLADGYSFAGVIYQQLFRKAPRKRPKSVIPSVRTNLHQLSAQEDVLIWFGHSSYFFQLDGKKFLVDPVFSGNASPLRGTNKSFTGADAYTVDDLPFIDYLLITHDHYDHLDYKTIVQLRDKIGSVVCPTGVAKYLLEWGYEQTKIFERGWYEDAVFDNGLVAHVMPARHFSGRGLFRNRTLWVSYLVRTASMKIYVGGDSGYDAHFKQVYEKYGAVDFAILDNGQYNLAWHNIHMLPEEVLQAAADLKATRVLPAHSGKFAMANHSWDEPLSVVTALSKKAGVNVVTPMIGEPVKLRDVQQQFKQWWVGVN
jgi:L-ascorbate metabolism protein UlaG (beta-lactamase superfamily)